jgi:hypothetical protein
MRPALTYLAAGAILLTPAMALGTPAPRNSGPPAPNSISPAHDTGQLFAECGEDGPTPGRSADAPGGGSAFADKDISVAGAHYAGEQDQNSKNTSSVSQYDTACARQPL